MNLLEQKHRAVLDEAQRRGQTDTSGMKLCFELLALASAIDRDCAARLGPHQLSEGKFVLLVLLRDRPEGLSPHELAERAGVKRATITGLLDGLERDCFLTRHHDRDDRRKIAVRLTPKGEATAETMFHEHAKWIDSLLADLSDDDRHQLTTLLGRVYRRTDAGAAAK